jgi:hypothetical protein
MLTTPIEQAQKVVADLRQKLSQLQDRSVLLGGEREAIAFDAHAGDERARARLTKVNKELLELGGEAKGLEAALAEGTRRVIAAETEARAEGERTRAKTGQYGSRFSCRPSSPPPCRAGFRSDDAAVRSKFSAGRVDLIFEPLRRSKKRAGKTGPL